MIAFLPQLQEATHEAVTFSLPSLTMTPRPRHTVLAALSVALVAAAGCAATTSSHTPSASGTDLPASSAPAQHPSAADLTTTLRGVGQHITSITVFTATTDENHLLGRQGEYTSKTAWVDPAAVAASGGGNPKDDPGSTTYGGGIEAFADHAAAKARLGLLKAFKPPLGDGYDYLSPSGLAILRLSTYLTPAQATTYKKDFDAIAK